MSYLVKLLLSLSLSGSLLLLLLLALKPWYQKRLSQTWQYYIWLAVALRFILPLPPIIKLPAQNQLFPSTEPSPALPMPANNIAFNNNQPVTLPENLTELPEPTTAAAQILPLAGWLLLIWAAVALLLLCRQITIYQSFVQYVKSASQPIEDIALLNQLAACAEAMHINSQKPLELAFNPLLSSPVCLGLFKPVIILPSMAKTLPPEQLACIFQHELTHLHRHDLLYKWLVQLLICLHWFNPFVYLLSRQVNRTCELACDEAVIASLPPEDAARQTYGETLLAFCQQSAYKNSLAAITLTEGAAQLKERLGAIMNFQPKTKWHKAAALLLTAAVCFSFFMLGAYAVPLTPKETTPFLEPGVFQKANNDQSGQSKYYVYTQNSFYCDGYIIEMGWNLHPEDIKNNDKTTIIQLENDKEMLVLFAKQAAQYIDHTEIRQAIAKLINQLQQDEKQMKIKLPYILQVIPAPPAQHAKLAEEFYQNGDLSPFAAIFPQLDSNAQAAYWQRIYANEQISFWACTVEYMPAELLREYLAKIDTDDRIAYFSIILDYLPQEDLTPLAEKYYQADEVAFFSILTGYMSNEQLAEWQKRAVADQKMSFASVLGVEPDWDDYGKDWDDDWDDWDDWEENWDEWEKNWDEWEEKLQEIAPLLLWLDQLD